MSCERSCTRRHRLGLTMIEVLVAVAIVGVLASVAVPMYLKKVKTSKAAEAPQNLKAIADGARLYYSRDFHDSSGTPVKKQFPCQTVGGACWVAEGKYQQPLDGSGTLYTLPQRCARGLTQYPANPKGWAISPWKELKVVVPRPHYFFYEYRTDTFTGPAGVGGTISWMGRTVPAYVDGFYGMAIGDLDCDGTYSYYVIYGMSTVRGGEVRPYPMVVKDALE